MERSDSPARAPSGLLLTGGASSRMGRTKALVEVEGVSFARRTAAALRAVADPVLAAGPAFDTGLESVADPGRGPFVAFMAGAQVLRARGHDAPILLVACDVPFVDEAALHLLLSKLEGHDGVVPVVGGRDQPSVSCWAPSAIAVGGRLVAADQRSMRAWIAELRVRRLSEDDWRGVASETAFTDADTPAELDSLIARDRTV